MNISNQTLKPDRSIELINTAFYRKASEYKLHHIVFWFGYLLFWILFFSNGIGLRPAIVNSTVIVVIQFAASYFNLYFLFPKLLKQKHYLSYVFSVMLTVALSCFLLAIAFFSLDTISPSSKPDIWTRDFFITNSISVSYTLAITMSLKLVKQWYERERQTKHLEKLNMETELKYLKTQINPHFLFNALNGLYALSLKKSDDAPEMVLKLADILRYVLYEGGSRWVPLEKEVNYIQSFLDLEKLRHGDRLRVEFNTEGNLGTLNVAPMLFLTFIENSFKHGISSTAEGGFVQVNIRAGQDEIFFSIRNSKPVESSRGINGDSGGIGLTNVKKRLHLLYPNQHELKIRDDEGTYLVELKLNAHPEMESLTNMYDNEMYDR